MLFAFHSLKIKFFSFDNLGTKIFTFLELNVYKKITINVDFPGFLAFTETGGVVYRATILKLNLVNPTHVSSFLKDSEFNRNGFISISRSVGIQIHIS